MGGSHQAKPLDSVAYFGQTHIARWFGLVWFVHLSSLTQDGFEKNGLFLFHFGAPKHHTQHMPIFFGKPLGRKEIFHQLRGLQFHGVLHGLSEVAPRGMKAKGLQVHAQRGALLAPVVVLNLGCTRLT